jgi:hypothetical protein
MSGLKLMSIKVGVAEKKYLKKVLENLGKEYVINFM